MQYNVNNKIRDEKLINQTQVKLKKILLKTWYRLDIAIM